MFTHTKWQTRKYIQACRDDCAGLGTQEWMGICLSAPGLHVRMRVYNHWTTIQSNLTPSAESILHMCESMRCSQDSLYTVMLCYARRQRKLAATVLHVAGGVLWSTNEVRSTRDSSLTICQVSSLRFSSKTRLDEANNAFQNMMEM